MDKLTRILLCSHVAHFHRYKLALGARHKRGQNGKPKLHLRLSNIVKALHENRGSELFRMGVEAIAPTRIDLAGGTLDIFPLNLFEGFGLTINASINLNVTARAWKRPDKRIVIRSNDLNFSETYANIESLTRSGPLDLLKNVVRNQQPKWGLNLETSCQAPQGSGLGGSSALAVAVVCALNKLTGRKRSLMDIVELAFNSELQTIMHPTGHQDQLAAAYGGIKVIWFKPQGTYVEKLNLSNGFKSELEENLILTYVGESRSSSMTNWHIFRNYIEHNASTIRALRAIKLVTLKMLDALRDEDMNEVARLLNLEWQNRKKLSAKIETAKMRRIIAQAMKTGGLAAKGCGAAGGGTVIILTQERKTRDVEEAITKQGGTVLKYKFAERGLRTRMIH
jgi:D-glycero-alpha-D-manno-heptose-7-phosphate kinase